MKDRTFEEVIIESGNPVYVTVTDRRGVTKNIQKADIIDVDHPGNVHSIAGGVFAFLGLFPLVVGIPTFLTGLQSDGDFAGFGVAAGGLLTFIGIAGVGGGLGMAIWGANTSEKSEKNYNRVGLDRVEVSVSNGVGLKFTF